ncbi:hypothetical protein LINGRAHAP2_LOCUS8807 [Linum grandiflorum]
MSPAATDGTSSRSIFRRLNNLAVASFRSCKRRKSVPFMLLGIGELGKYAKSRRSSSANYIRAFGDANKVWTLICFKRLSREECAMVLEKFRRLRVLVIVVEGSYSDASTQLHCISKMKHLRLLAFKGYGMKNLPDSVVNLLNLKYLYFGHDHMLHMTKGIGRLKSLQTLPVFVVSESSDSNGETAWAGLDELRGLNALRGQLIIRNLVKARPSGEGAYVVNCTLFLQSLILDWGRVDCYDYDDDEEEDNDDEEITPTCLFMMKTY